MRLRNTGDRGRFSGDDHSSGRSPEANTVVFWFGGMPGGMKRPRNPGSHHNSRLDSFEGCLLADRVRQKRVVELHRIGFRTSKRRSLVVLRLPAASIARTLKTWWRKPSLRVVRGERQGLKRSLGGTVSRGGVRRSGELRRFPSVIALSLGLLAFPTVAGAADSVYWTNYSAARGSLTPPSTVAAEETCRCRARALPAPAGSRSIPPPTGSTGPVPKTTRSTTQPSTAAGAANSIPPGR